MSPAKLATAAAFYDPGHYVPSESMGHLLHHVVQAIRREAEVRMARHGLTDAQWKPLWMISTGRADTALEMARELGMDAGAMTRMLDRLVAKGLVERTRSEADRRVAHLRLTEAGEAAAAHIPQELAEVNNDFLAGFSEREWNQLKKFLKRMLANGQAMQAAQEAA